MIFNKGTVSFDQWLENLERSPLPKIFPLMMLISNNCKTFIGVVRIPMRHCLKFPN